MKYKGYYIDHVIFNSKEDIDRFILNQAIEAYKMAVKMFMDDHSMASSVFADRKADTLNRLGMTWEEIEAIEIEVYEAA